MERHEEAEPTGLERYLAPILFVVTMLYYMISLTPFVDLTAASSIDPAADRSNVINQVAFLSLTAMLWIITLRSPSRSLVARPRGLLIVIFVWFIAASIIAAHPDVALKRVVLAGLTMINAGLFLLLPRSDRQFAHLLAVSCLVTLIVAYLGVAVLPRLAIHQASEIREPMNAGLWRGHFPHKNAAAAAMVVIAFFGLYVRSMGSRLAGLAILILATFFLTQTGGKTASAELPGILIAAWVFERWPASRIPLVVGGIVGFNAMTIGSAVSPAIGDLLQSLGMDPTFTNRTDIWRIAVSAIADSPIFGHGFQGFWQTDELVYSGGGGASWAVAAYNGHNGYLDAAVTTGLPGLVLTVCWVIVVPLLDFGRTQSAPDNPASPNNLAVTRLFLRIWLYGAFSGCVESIFFQSGNLVWFCMAVSIFGLRLQSSARAVASSQTTLQSTSAVAHA